MVGGVVTITSHVLSDIVGNLKKLNSDEAIHEYNHQVELHDEKNLNLDSSQFFIDLSFEFNPKDIVPTRGREDTKHVITECTAQLLSFFSVLESIEFEIEFDINLTNTAYNIVHDIETKSSIVSNLRHISKCIH
jgi:hypothetical protein